MPRPGVAEADVEGFNHLKASEGQPQDERWPLGGEKKKEEGLELNPAIPPFLLLLLPPSSPLFPQRHCLSSHLHSDRAVQTEPVMVCMS